MFTELEPPPEHSVPCTLLSRTFSNNHRTFSNNHSYIKVIISKRIVEMARRAKAAATSILQAFYSESESEHSEILLVLITIETKSRAVVRNLILMMNVVNLIKKFFSDDEHDI